MDAHRELGPDAVGCLSQHGYRILARRFGARSGTIDFVAWEGDTLCFVAVAHRWRRGTPATVGALGPDRVRRICRTAVVFMARHHLERERYRFDVLAACADAPGFLLVRNAFPFAPLAGSTRVRQGR
jgi:putative endonuclease